MKEVFQKLELWRYRRRIDRSLALHLRGEVRKDGLSLVGVSNRLEIQWRARGLHPWDDGIAQPDRAARFHEQLLHDTEAVIRRLFEALPHIDILDVSVLGPGSDTVLMTGTVSRAALDTVRNLLSVRMRLEQLGVKHSEFSDRYPHVF